MQTAIDATVPAWLFELAIEALAEIEQIADSAEARINDPEAVMPVRAGIATGALMVAGIKARAAREVLPNAL